jgi:predicted RNA-binding Zn-ribbon protein involved in translation (DUF1610 family)
VTFPTNRSTLKPVLARGEIDEDFAPAFLGSLSGANMEAAVIYCTSCGTANKPGARFCFKCGAPLEAVPEPVRAQPAPAQPAPRSDFISLNCPNCGGRLEITADMERFACGHCGSEHLVRRSDGAVSLAPVVDGLKQVVSKFDQALAGSDRMAAEQTIARLKKEIPELERQVNIAQERYRSASRVSSSGGLSKTILWLGIAALVISFGGMCIAAAAFSESNSDLYQNISDRLLYFFIAGVPLIVIGGIASLTARSRKRRQARAGVVEQAGAELSACQAELDERRRQLAQLQRYTAER